MLFKILLFCIITLSIQGREKPFSHTNKSYNTQLRNQNRKLNKISKSIRRIEKKLERNNNLYLSQVKSREKSLLQLDSLRETSRNIKNSLEDTKKNLDKKLLNLTLLSFSEKDPSHTLAKELVKKNLVSLIHTYKSYANQAGIISKKIDAVSQKYHKRVKTEREILVIVERLEKLKNTKAQAYVVAQEKRDKLQGIIKRKKRKSSKKRASRSLKIAREIGLFSNPIKKRTSLDYRKKGVTFLFRKSQAVHATRSGKVAYKGSLANYGNVIMIDHGKGLRSVLLGDFSSNLPKGTAVKEGDILGHARIKAGTEGKIYFEVRNDKKVYKTIDLIKV